MGVREGATLARPPPTPDLRLSPLRVDITKETAREGLRWGSPPEPFMGVSGSSPMEAKQEAGARQALRPQLHKPDAEGGRGEAAVGLGGAIGGGRADPLLNSQLAEAACYPWTWTAAGVGTPLPRRPERRAGRRSAPGAPPAAPRRGRAFGATPTVAKQRAAPRTEAALSA